MVSGNSQTGVVGQELSEPVTIRVTDAEGRPVQGQLVNFHVVAGARACGASRMTPGSKRQGTIFAMLFAVFSVNHMFPSGPRVML